MRILLLLLSTIPAIFPFLAFGQRIISGKVVSASDGRPLAGASIRIEDENRGVNTAEDGTFSISIADSNSTLTVSFLGYATAYISFPFEDPLIISLEENVGYLETVTVSTGYYEIPHERATGSFTVVDNELLSRSVNTDVLSRLEDVTGSLMFDERTPSNRRINIRGLSTIFANAQPLIVLNNFPYEGDINNINPNDVESVTVLRDAAAASIWGVRAGNGVIVITTKKGRFNEGLKLSFNANTTVGSEPHVAGLRGFLPSADFIEVEQFLFGQGFYNAQESSTSFPVLSPVIELLIQERDGLISAEEASRQIDELKLVDVRKDFARYLYKPSINQQYSLKFQGGGNNTLYYFSAGYDNNHDNLGAIYDRISLRSDNTFSPSSKLKVHAGIAYVQTQDRSGRPAHTDIRSSSSRELYPYARLADDQGNPLAIAKDYRIGFIQGAQSLGLLNWEYTPLDDYKHVSNVTRQQEILLNSGADYEITPHFTARIKYQYQKQEDQFRSHQREEAYSTRNDINRFTQFNEDGSLSYPIPHGARLYTNSASLQSHTARGQIDYSRIWPKSTLTALAGGEIREVVNSSNSGQVYGYDDNVLTNVPVDYVTSYQLFPSGFDRIAAGTSFAGTVNRFTSYYMNTAFSYGNYTVSASGRKDASNLFGVRSNQRSVPLWSGGVSWNIHDEDFFRSNFLDALTLRVTYGYNGNLDRTMSALATIRVLPGNLNGMPYANIRTYPNPELRWERVRMFNVGVDLKTRNSVLEGRLEFYLKKGKDLIGEQPIDPTVGLPAARVSRNVANMQGRGVDIELSSQNINGPFRWHTNALLSYASNEVVDYDTTSAAGNAYIGGGIAPLEGKPVYSMFSYSWAGLDPQTGNPLGMVNGEASTDYASIIRSTPVDDLVYHGPVLAPFFGSLRNAFSWKNLSLSVNITYRFGYYFRRPTISYSRLFNNWAGHEDLTRRWRQPGDEQYTNVPSLVYPNNANRDNFYTNSAILIEKGDHIRLKDVSLSYTFDRSRMKSLHFSSLKCYLYADNLGFLWRANRQGLDPDHIALGYALPITVSAGISLVF